MERTTFLIDGFNLYHSVREACNELDDQSLKWLNISSLCSHYLYLIHKRAKLQDIYYFSALAHHIDQRTVSRHEIFLSALKSTGIKVQLSNFKKKYIKCNYCLKRNIRYEEKETDVALAVKILELFHYDNCDNIVLVTGDTDIIPAVKTAKKLFSDKKIYFLFPYKRWNYSLKELAKGYYFGIKTEQYHKHKFPDEIDSLNGGKIKKPKKWS